VDFINELIAPAQEVAAMNQAVHLALILLRLIRHLPRKALVEVVAGNKGSVVEIAVGVEAPQGVVVLQIIWPLLAVIIIIDIDQELLLHGVVDRRVELDLDRILNHAIQIILLAVAVKVVVEVRVPIVQVLINVD
jgi:hypothetical protein